MQTTLLGLGIAIILALVAALVAPLVVDWNHYRAAFEKEASRLVGLDVRVSGAIEARLLPTPRIALRDVEIDAAGGRPRMSAASVELEVALGSLLRGQVQATELRVVAPQISLGLDSAGAVDWPAAPSLRPEAFAVSRLEVENGRLFLGDAGSGARLVLQKVWFDGDIRSFLGPFRGEGTFVLDNQLYAYRISASRFEPGTGLKLRLGVDPSDRPLTAEIDGALNFDRGVPRFDGALTLARPAGAALAGGARVIGDPWQLTGKVEATPASASLRELALQFGPQERAINLSGQAEVTFGAHPHAAGTVAATEFDLDRMLAAPEPTRRPPLLMVKSFCEALMAAVKPPLPVAVGVKVDALTMGGTVIRSLHGDVRFDDGGWRLSDVAFRAPGLTEVNVSGRLEDGPQGLAFSGPAKLESADLKALMAWLEGRNDRPPGPSETFTAAGDVTIASDRFALDRLSAVLDRESIEGRLAYTRAEGDRPAALDAQLRAASLDIDAVVSFAEAALSDGALEMPRRAALVLDVGSATFAGVDARMVNAQLKFDTGILHIDRLSIGDLGGAALQVSGRLDELSSRPRGRLTLDLDARTLAGLTDIAGKLAPQVAGVLRPVVDRLAPAKVHGVLTVDRSAGAATSAKLDLGGTVGALRLVFNGETTGDPARPDAATVRIAGRFNADDGGALLKLLDLDHVFAVDQLPGQMTISVGGPLNGDIRVNGLAVAGGFSAAADGTLHLHGGQPPSGSLHVKASAADFTPLRNSVTGAPGGAVALAASAIIGVAGADLTVTDLDVTAGKASMRGRLDLKLSNPIGVDGEIAANAVDVAAIAAALLGLPRAPAGAAAPWSDAPPGTGAFGNLNGAVTFKIDRAALAPALAVNAFNGVMLLQPAEIAFRELDGSLAGGRLTGELEFRRGPDGLAAQGHVELAGANAAALVAPDTKAIEGSLTVKLHGESIGQSPAALIAGLHGGGTVRLNDARFAGFDTAAFAAAIHAADQAPSFEAPQIRTAVGAAMDKGRFAVPRADAEVTITGGQLRLSNTQLHAQDGSALSLDGVLDLNEAAVDARMTLSVPPPAHALISDRPQLAVTVKGPIGAAERKVDLSPLVGWLALRAAELQTRRIESVEANRRPEVRGPVVRPPSPAVRFLSMGTALETVDRADGAAPGEPGPRAFDRLRPDTGTGAPSGRVDHAPTAALPATSAKPAAPRSAPGSDKTTATAEPGSARPAAPQPALRSPLDLLFRLQN